MTLEAVALVDKPSKEWRKTQQVASFVGLDSVKERKGRLCEFHGGRCEGQRKPTRARYDSLTAKRGKGKKLIRGPHAGLYGTEEGGIEVVLVEACVKNAPLRDMRAGNAFTAWLSLLT